MGIVILFLSIMESQMKLLAHSAICKAVRLYMVRLKTGKAVQADLCQKNLNGAEILRIQTSLSPAPMKLMEIIRCNCKAGCSTGRCTCKKHGLQCSYAYRECKV